MARFIAYLIVFIAAIWAGVYIAQDPGYALFSYGAWSLEMPLWLAIFIIIVVFLFFYWLFTFFSNTRFSLLRFRHWKQYRRDYKAQNKTARGLVEWLEGRNKSAEYFLREGASNTQAPVINYLFAAQAAHGRGKYERRDKYLKKAHQCDPSADIAIGLVKAKLQMAHQQWDAALEGLRYLHQVAPNQKQVLILLVQLLCEAGEWDALKQLLPDIACHHVLSPEAYADLEVEVYANDLRKSAEALEGALDTLHHAWQQLPRALRKSITLITAYAQALYVLKDTPTLLDLLQETLKKQWDEHLIHLYGLVKSTKPAAQLAYGERLLAHHDKNAALLLALGRLAIQAKLWGKAKHYLELSLAAQKSREAYGVLGDLLVQLGEKDAALVAYQSGNHVDKYADS